MVLRLIRHGKSSKKWMRFGAYTSELCRSHWRPWSSCGASIMPLRLDSTRSLYVMSTTDLQSSLKVLCLFKARKFIQDQSKAYMTAKEVLKQLRSHLAILFPPPALSSTTGRKPLNLPEPTSPHSEGHRMLAKSWRAYLQWEEKNPLDIEDKASLNARLLATYKKAVIRMRFNPETWYVATFWRT